MRKTRESESGLAKARIGGPQPVTGDAVEGQQFGGTRVHGSASRTTNHTSQTHSPPLGSKGASLGNQDKVVITMAGAVDRTELPSMTSKALCGNNNTRL